MAEREGGGGGALRLERTQHQHGLQERKLLGAGNIPSEPSGVLKAGSDSGCGFCAAGSDERAGAPGEEGERRSDLWRQTAARWTSCAADHRGETRCPLSTEPEVLLQSVLIQTVGSAQSFTAALQTQWSWILQLCCCIETHLKENTAHFQVGSPTRTRARGHHGPELIFTSSSFLQFFSDVKETEEKMRKMQDTMKRKYTCDRSVTVTRLEDLLQDAAVSSYVSSEPSEPNRTLNHSLMLLFELFTNCSDEKIPAQVIIISFWSCYSLGSRFCSRSSGSPLQSD